MQIAEIITLLETASEKSSGLHEIDQAVAELRKVKDLESMVKLFLSRYDSVTLDVDRAAKELRAALAR